MLEIYDDVGNTNRAIELGLARTGKLVTSAALILMFSFLVLSSSPGVDVKQFGIGLAAGIIFDATVIRGAAGAVADAVDGGVELVDAAAGGAGAVSASRRAGRRDRFLTGRPTGAKRYVAPRRQTTHMAVIAPKPFYHPTRYLPRIDLELLACGARGHVLACTDVRELTEQDSVIVREIDGVRTSATGKCASTSSSSESRRLGGFDGYQVGRRGLGRAGSRSAGGRPRPARSG